MKKQLLKIVLLALVAMLGLSADALAQRSRVTGSVVDAADQSPLPGVSIAVKGTTIGTVTDFDGNFALNVPSLNDSLQISFVGYTTQIIGIGGRTTLTITLAEDVKVLGEILVVGYGTLGRESVTSAIEKVTAEELADIPAPSALEALQGRASGVTIAADEVGEQPVIRIRGLTTPNSNGPLYVVDGVPIGNIVAINPGDIASMEVLKDASASAIYGSRASGGVIIITTKRGNSGQQTGSTSGIATSFNSYYGVASQPKRLDLLNTEQYIQYATDIATAGNQSVPARFSDQSIRNTNIDYQDEVLRSAPIMNFDVGVASSSEALKYRLSVGYLDQQGTIINNGFQRYTANLNTDFNRGRFNFGQSLTLAHMRRNNIRETDIMDQVMRMPPYLNPRNADLPGGYAEPDLVDGQDAFNPVRSQEMGVNRYKELRVLGNVYADLRIMQGLNLRQVFGIEATEGNNFDFDPSYYGSSLHQQPYANIYEQRYTYYSPLSTTTLNLSRPMGNHEVNAVAGIETQSFNNRSINGSGRNYLTNDIDVLRGVENASVGGYQSRDVLLSYFGRLNYNFAGKYLLQGSLRRDGYSRFGPDSRFGLFPSLSAGWNLDEEGFMKSLPFDIFKLRASYGRVGNNNAIGQYEYQPSIDLAYYYVFGGALVPGGTVRRLANEALRWESTDMVNIGADVAMLRNRLNFSVEYYQNITNDILLSVSLPNSFGFDETPRFNTADVRTKGMEFNLGYRGEAGAFGYNIDGNFSTSFNKVKSLGLGQPFTSWNHEGEDLVRVAEGEPLFHYYGYKVDRLFQASDFTGGQLNAGIPTQPGAAPGDIKFMDIAGAPDANGNPTGPDGVVDAYDRTNLGSGLPKYTYGLNTGINYKNFDLSLFFQGHAGNKIYRAWGYWSEGMVRVFNATTAVLDRWTPTNTDTDMPRGIVGDPNRNVRPSDRWLEKGDFVRLKLITLGYQVPPRLTGVQNLRLYVQAQNLFTATGYSGFDPEVGSAYNDAFNNNAAFGIDIGQYPQPRTFLFGLQLGF